MVHSMEHGAVWVTYDPAVVTGAALESLSGRVEGQQYTMLSHYPGLESPVTLQSWGHQLGWSAPMTPASTSSSRR